MTHPPILALREPLEYALEAGVVGGEFDLSREVEHDIVVLERVETRLEPLEIRL